MPTDHSPTATAELDHPPQLSKPQLRVTLAALVLASALAAIEGNIVTTALPRIASELNGLSQLSWIVTGFMLAQSASMPLYGKISDMWGRKPLFLFAVTLFIVGSGLSGIAQDMIQLIIFRGLQGAGAAGIMTMSSATLADILGPRERSRYQGLFMGVFAVSSLAGPPLGGLLITLAGWRSVFLVNVPIGLIILVVLAVVLPGGQKRVSHKVDFLGAALLVASTATLLLTLTWGGLVHPWVSPTMAGMIVGTIVLGVLLFLRERVASEPILPLHIFHDRTVAIAAVTTALVAFPFFGAVVFLPLYFQVVDGMTPAAAGLMTVAQIGGLLVASTAGGFVVAHTGKYKLFIVAGVACLAAGLAMIGACAWLRLEPLPFLIGLAVLGIGGGLCMPNFTVAVQNAVSRKDLGAATAIMTFANTLAGAAGVASAGAILAGRLDSYVRSHLPGVDPGPLLRAGLDELNSLPPQAHEVVLAAHAHAVAATFLSGALATGLALAAALCLPSVTMHARPKSEPADAVSETA